MVAASRAVPSSLSCSCGCCRISTSTRLSIVATLSQTQSGSGLPQCGQAGGRFRACGVCLSSMSCNLRVMAGLCPAIHVGRDNRPVDVVSCFL